MRLVIQRVSSACVIANGHLSGSIEKGLLVLVGFEAADDDTDIAWMASKLVQMRIFSDNNGLMNLSVQDVNGDILLISQFTLHASTKKGNRPSFIAAARPDQALALYESFVEHVEKLLAKKVFTGVFGADMQVRLENDGPVTIFIDSKNKQ